MLSERAMAAVAELLKANKKDRAKMALRTRKLHDKQVEALSNNIIKLDEQMVALETAVNQAEVLSVLKTANSAMSSIQKQMPLDHVERLLEENEEGAQYVAELNELLKAQPDSAMADDIDEELNELESQVLDEQNAAMPAAPENPEGWKKPEEEKKDESEEEVPDLPAAPTHEAITEGEGAEPERQAIAA